MLNSSIIQDQWRNTNDFLYIQGNHDDVSYPYDEGANEYEDYIVYCVNGNYNDFEMGGSRVFKQAGDTIVS